MTHVARRRAALLLLLCAGACGAPAPATAVGRALGYLWAQQGPDGLVHSDVYGTLRRGESLTAAVLLATARLPAADRTGHTAAIDRALHALALPIDARRDAPIDYPCYTAAHHLHALALLQPTGWQETAAVRIAQLRTLQFSSANGWERTDAVFGGFGLGDGPPRKPAGADLVTLSVTTAAVEALRAAGVATTDALLADARSFVERCQRLPADGGDGGFHGCPGGGVLGGKGGADAAGSPRSYGPATADGVRALIGCGHDPDSTRVRAAVAWLDGRTGDLVPGLLPELEPSLRLYWAGALLSTWRTLQRPTTGHAGPALRGRVAARQREDGACTGFGPAMKEDDPVVATVLALPVLDPR
jgi:hypothetical protein